MEKKKKLLKWQVKYLADILAWSNVQVLEEYSNLCGGDSYDGCLTKEGEWKFPIISKEMFKRLVTCGFITQEEADGYIG